MKTEDILNEREKTHGDFAKLRVGLAKAAGLSSASKLSDAQNIALSMILTKIARIVCGDPTHADHWDDIAGYAMLGRGNSTANNEEKEGCFLCNKNIEKPSHVLDWVDFVCETCIKKGWENFYRMREENSVETAYNRCDDIKISTGEIGQCSICNRVLHETEIRKNVKDGEPLVCFGCFINGESESTQEEEKSTSSKMEHVVKCDRCDIDLSGMICFTISRIDKNKIFCPKCALKTCEENPPKKIEHVGDNDNLNHFCRKCGEEIRQNEYGYESNSSVCWDCSGWGAKKYKNEEAISKKETTDGEWYDAEKCLPKFNTRVIIEYINYLGAIEKSYAETNIFNSLYSWSVVDDAGLYYLIPHKIIRWKYADE